MTEEDNNPRKNLVKNCALIYPSCQARAGYDSTLAFRGCVIPGMAPFVLFTKPGLDLQIRFRFCETLVFVDRCRHRK